MKLPGRTPRKRSTIPELRAHIRQLIAEKDVLRAREPKAMSDVEETIARINNALFRLERFSTNRPRTMVT